MAIIGTHKHPLWTEKSHDPYIFPTSHYESVLSTSSPRTFLPAGLIQIKVMEIGARDYIFTESSSLAQHLRHSKFKGTRIILIPQRHSWDYLSISEEAFRILVSHFNIFPGFLDVVCAFGLATSEINDTISGCYRWQHESVSEICFLLKLAEKHGRDEPDEPWCIRKMGFYHRHDSLNETDTFIILNPVMSFQQRLKRARERLDQTPTARDLHNLALSQSSCGWRWYLSYWESRLNDLIVKTYASEMDSTTKTSTTPALLVNYIDFKGIQVIHDRLNTAKYVLESNLDIFRSERGERSGVGPTEPFFQELEVQYLRVNNLIERASSSSNLMQNMISFGSLNALKMNSESTYEMARLAEDDSKNMILLTMKSQKDAATLKKMTWLTSIYLPASFVSQFLSMGYISLNVHSGSISLRGSSELWIFLILTVLLLAITFGAWLCLDAQGKIRRWHKKPRQSETDQEKV